MFSYTNLTLLFYEASAEHCYDHATAVRFSSVLRHEGGPNIKGEGSKRVQTQCPSAQGVYGPGVQLFARTWTPGPKRGGVQLDQKCTVKLWSSALNSGPVRISVIMRTPCPSIYGPIRPIQSNVYCRGVVARCRWSSKLSAQNESQ